MSISMSDLNDRVERIRKLEEGDKKMEELKNSDKGFEQFNEDVLSYLRAKFPDESDVTIQEAAAFLSYRTATIILEMQSELNNTMVKFYGDTTRKTIEMIGGMMK